MSEMAVKSIEKETSFKYSSVGIRHILKRPRLYIMLLPGLLYFIIFKYIPMWGIIISFQVYHPILGVMGSK